MRVALLLVATVLAGSVAQAECPPPPATSESLLALATRGFEMADDAQRNALAVALVPCLASSDPLLRDRVAFEALSAWMRGKHLTAHTLRQILGRLQPWLSADHADPDDFGKPFAALVLSEIVRADRLDPFLTTDERVALLSAGTDYLRRRKAGATASRTVPT